MRNFLLIILGLLPFCLDAQIITEVIEYKHNDTVLEGYLAYDKSMEGKRPAIIIFHEWTGINDYIKTRTEQLAGLGYVVFAADLYGKGVRPSDPKEAGIESAKYKNNIPLTRNRAIKAYEYILDHELSHSGKIAAIGYCFGGMVALELARTGTELAGVASFHGSVKTTRPEDAENIKSSVLILHGAIDPYVPDEELNEFREAMEAAQKDYQMIYYSGAVHAFSNPSSGEDPEKGAAYNLKADQRSYEALLGFLKEIFSVTE